MNDIRDEVLGDLLERAAVEVEAQPVDRLPEVLRRGGRRRAARLTATVATVAVFVGAVSWVGLSLPAEETVIPADVADWRTFASLEDNGWTIQVPPPWHTTELPPCENAPERIGVLVTNVEFEFRDPRGGPPHCEDRLLFAGFPRNGVALGFYPRGSFPGLFGPTLDTVLPLTPDLLLESGGIVGGPAESNRSVNLGTETLGMIRRFVGPDATEPDVEALDRMLESFRVRGAPHWVEGFVEPKNELSDLRVEITHPSGWNLRTYPRWSVIDAPNPIVALESPSLRPGSCRLSPFAPWIRYDRLRDPSVLLLISDASDSWTVPDLGPRPEHFRFQDALEDGDGRCGTDVRMLRFGFEAAGRQIYVDVVANASVLGEEPGMVRYILDSIEISKAS